MCDLPVPAILQPSESVTWLHQASQKTETKKYKDAVKEAMVFFTSYLYIDRRTVFVEHRDSFKKWNTA